MKTRIITPVVLSAALLSAASPIKAQSTLDPTGRVLGGYWGGWEVAGSQWGSNPTTTGNYYFDQLTTSGVEVTSGGAFSAPVGYIVDPSWAGTFTVTGEKTSSSGAARAAYISEYLTLSASEGVVVEGVLGQTSFVYSTNSGGADYTLDFTGLTNGYLPAGTIIFARGRYDVGDAFTISSDLTTPYLEYLSDEYLYQSASYPAGAIAEITFDAGIYSYGIISQIPSNASTGAPAVFVTTENLQSLTFSAGGLTDAHNISIFAPLIPVPEPSGTLLVGLTGSLALLRRRRSA